MVPTARKKLQSYLQKHETGSAINPHGPGSPPLQAAPQAVVSASSPMVSRQDRQAIAETMKISMPAPKGFKLGKSAQPVPASPQIKDLPSQERPEGHEEMPDWDAASEEQHDEGGLRERWEEQSNINSLFSEGEPNRPASAQPSAYGDDASSDILDNRQPVRRNRNIHHRVSESAPYFRLENGQLRGPSPQSLPFARGFNTSMITHAPKNIRADVPTYRRDPFGSTSGESSPKPTRDPSFIRSSFPIRGNDETKRLSHFERASLHMQSGRRTSPETFDSQSDIAQPGVYAGPIQEPAPVSKRSTALQVIENAVLDWEGDDSDDSSQEDELGGQERQHTPKATRRKLIPDDATVVLNPQKPLVPPKPQKTVVLQEKALQGSPVPREPVRYYSPPKKRRRNVDYDDAALQKMSFADLQKQPFDHDPTREVAQSPAKPPADNLGDRLMFYSSKDEGAQIQFFNQMPVREWEDSGDWFLEQFGDIVTKMKETRQMKRRIVEQYESEVSSREEEVRRKRESIDRKLSKLKHDSKAMLTGNQSHG